MMILLLFEYRQAPDYQPADPEFQPTDPDSQPSTPGSPVRNFDSSVLDPFGQYFGSQYLIENFENCTEKKKKLFLKILP